MQSEFLIAPCHGMAIDVKAGQTIAIIDVEGGQVADFFAEAADNGREFLSTGVTIDCNESLTLHVGDYIYSNLYRPLFRVISDDVGSHDLLHPCCRPEMFEFFYRNGKGHPNCLDNINRCLQGDRPIIHPLNIFMNTKIKENGKIAVLPPESKAGDKLVLQALADVKLGIAACSVSESGCNSGKCSAIKIILSD